MMACAARMTISGPARSVSSPQLGDSSAMARYMDSEALPKTSIAVKDLEAKHIVQHVADDHASPVPRQR